MKNKILSDFIKGKISIYAKIFFLFTISAFIVMSCKEEEPLGPAKANVQVLSASASSVVLNQKNANSNAVTFNWTSGTNHGTQGAIDYTLQFDKAGNNFAAPLQVSLGRVVYSNSYKVSDFNNLLKNELQLEPGISSQIEVRVKSVTTEPSIEPDYSNVVTLEATPYAPVSSTLFLIGSATANGWDAGQATALNENTEQPGTFTYQGTFTAGEFKFITTLGEFLPSYNKGEDNDHIILRTEDSQPDDKFIIDQAGVYSVKVNLLDLSFEIEKMDASPYSELWIVGDATPNGWNIDNPNVMKQSSNDPFIFTYQEILKAGEFKIATAKSWDAPFYRPTMNNPEITATEVQLSAGDPDNKWRIATEGPYKITLNLRDLTISIAPFIPYTELWIVGDATPNGWNIDDPTPMVADPSDPYVFSYTGALTAGEFKIATAKSWDDPFYRPTTNAPELTNTEVQLSAGEPDNKWKLSTPGNYKITLNQLYHTISIEQL